MNPHNCRVHVIAPESSFHRLTTPRLRQLAGALGRMVDSGTEDAEVIEYARQLERAALRELDRRHAAGDGT